ncbi:MAG: TonB-dependent receptor, partial [bacterium]
MGFALPVYASQIWGMVVDKLTGEPLPVASVVLEGTGKGTTTNLDGYFSLTGLQEGSYTLSISFLGYRTESRELLLKQDQSVSLRVELTPVSIVRKETEVRIKRDPSQEVRSSPLVSTVPIEGKILRSTPSLLGERDVLRAIQMLPGVKTSSELSSGLNIRGGSTDQTLILLDHNIVYNTAHMFGLFSTFNSDAVKRVDLMKGGFPAQYGGRSGSVLEVVTNEGNRKETHGLLSWGSLSARAVIEGPLPYQKGSYFLAARRTYLDPIISWARKAMETDLPDYYFYDTNSKLNIDLTSRSTLTFSSFIGDDVRRFEFGPSDERIVYTLKWGNRTFSTRYRHMINPHWFATGVLSFSQYRSTWGIKDEEVILDEGINRLRDYSLRGDIEHTAWRDHKPRLGFWITRYQFLLQEGNPTITWVNVDTGTYNYSLYLQDEWRISPFWAVQGGLRYYYHQAGKHQAWDPRVSIVYHYDPRIRVKMALGRYHQWLNLITIGDVFSNFDVWVPIDASIKPSYSDQMVVGYEWDREDGIQFTTEAYFTLMNRVVWYNPIVDRASQAQDAFVNGEGYAYGWEVMFNKRFGRTTGWLGYSLSYTRRRFPQSLINNGEWFYPSWDRRHDVVLVLNRTLSPSWDLSGSWRFISG